MEKKRLVGRSVLASLVMCLILAATVYKAAALTVARSVTANFSSAVGNGTAIVLRNGEQFFYQVLAGASGTQTNKTVLQKSCDGSNFGDLSVAVSTTNNYGIFSSTISVDNCPGGKTWYRFAATTYTAGASSTTITELDNVVSSFYNNSNESVADVLDGGVQFNGYAQPRIRTMAQLSADIPAAPGRLVICSNCTAPYSLCSSTGPLANQWARIQTGTVDTTKVGCGVGN